MKAAFLLGVSLLSITLPIRSQVVTNLSPAALSPDVRPQPLSYSAVARGAHFTVMEAVSQSTDSSGRLSLVTNRYTIIGNGLNVQDARGNWVEARPVVQVYQDSLVCTGASYRVILNRNLNTAGAVDLETSDKQRIVSNPLGIGFFDPDTGRSVLLAQIKDCEAAVVSNRVVYADAFEGNGIRASVAYRYEAGHFHQDVSFASRPAIAPADFGMGSRTRLELMTELVQSPVPGRVVHLIDQETDPSVRARMAEPDVVDETLSFGAEMIMPLGKAFQTSRLETNGPPRGIPVAKRLMEISGRQVLVESLSWQEAKPFLDQLPQRTASATGSKQQADKRRHLPESARLDQQQTFATRLAQASQSRRIELVASNSKVGTAAQQVGFVMDYELVQSANDYTFQSGHTYLININSPVTIGYVTIQSGAVIKFASAYGILRPTYILQCPSSGPKAVLTDMNDDSIGQTISGSAGHYTGYHAYAALDLSQFDNGGNGAYVQNLDIRFISLGVAAPTIGGNWCYVYDCWFFQLE